MIDLLDRLRSLTGRPVLPDGESLRAALLPNLTSTIAARERVAGGWLAEIAPELQVQLDAIPGMVRDEDGDRDYPDSFYRPLRKDLNPDRVNRSCSCCYYDLGNNMEPHCAINPTGDAATCEHFKPR